MWPFIYVLILYVSDDPLKFNYFNTAFTERLNQNEKIKFLEDKKIEEQFLINIIKDESGFLDFKKHIINSTKLIETKIKAGQFQTALTISNKILKDFETQLLAHPYHLDQSTRVTFYFWNTIAQIHTPQALTLISEFLTSATLSQKNLLESLLTKDLYKKYSRLSVQQKSLPILKYEIKNAEHCNTFINGKQFFQKSMILPIVNKRVVSAICKNGFYSQILNPSSKPSIVISPRIEKKVVSMPTINLLPIELIKNHHSPFVVLMYWSEKQNYIKTILLNPSDLTDKRELFLQLKTKADFESVGDKISQFIFNYSKYLLELKIF